MKRANDADYVGDSTDSVAICVEQPATDPFCAMSDASTSAISATVETLQQELEAERANGEAGQRALLQCAEAGQYLLSQNEELRLEIHMRQQLDEEHKWLDDECGRLRDEVEQLRQRLQLDVMSGQARHPLAPCGVQALRQRRSDGGSESSDSEASSGGCSSTVVTESDEGCQELPRQVPTPAGERVGRERADLHRPRRRFSFKEHREALEKAHSRAEDAMAEVWSLEAENGLLRASCEERRSSEQRLLEELARRCGHEVGVKRQSRPTSPSWRTSHGSASAQSTVGPAPEEDEASDSPTEPHSWEHLDRAEGELRADVLGPQAQLPRRCAGSFELEARGNHRRSGGTHGLLGVGSFRHSLKFVEAESYRLEHLEHGLGEARADAPGFHEQLVRGQTERRELEEELISTQMLLKQEQEHSESLSAEVRQLVAALEEARVEESARRMASSEGSEVVHHVQTFSAAGAQTDDGSNTGLLRPTCQAGHDASVCGADLPTPRAAGAGQGSKALAHGIQTVESFLAAAAAAKASAAADKSPFRQHVLRRGMASREATPSPRFPKQQPCMQPLKSAALLSAAEGWRAHPVASQRRADILDAEDLWRAMLQLRRRRSSELEPVLPKPVHRLVYVGRFLPRQWPPRHTQLAVKTMSTSGAKVLGECRSKIPERRRKRGQLAA
eukprot:CAMPEP_0117618990 /NCGR_PEP_ID=MMETSP0784-20121206/86390_1 /TAXON_ID=39447 /ORGANISM="" /LENGTH=673 /DNA_ID=CAMNT_0005422875 /DNA_START=88 /DNA_END=2106 /DNA_ORIENTATION=-